MARSSLFPPSVQPGKPILPPCPPGWSTVTFGDVLDIVVRPIDLDDDVEYQLVTARRSRGGVVARSRLFGRDVLTKTQFRIEGDDFLISNRQIIHGGCGIVPQSLSGSVVSNEYSVLRPKPQLSLAYLAYLSHSIYFQQTCFHASVGVDVEKMIFDCERWLEFRVHLPPLPEQLLIANILTNCSKTIAATQAVIEQTERLRSKVLIELFQGKNSAGPKVAVPNWKTGNLGVHEIPANWRLVHLVEVAKLESGHTPSKGVEEYWGGDINWLSLHDTRNLRKRVIFETTQKTTESGIRNSSARILPAGTVCFSRTASVGHCVITGREMATSQDFANYVCGNDLSNRYLMYLFRNMGHIWSKLAAGSTHQTIYMPTFEQLQIALPPISEQLRIVKIADSFYDEIEALERDLVSKTTLLSTLTFDLVTGRERDDEAPPLAAE
ncbi:restriction endonuclease subunit S (plasmid) [Ensifer adhaerens]|uniref:restriction endonuclease subunit S n=1 Tax=Ensifer adhaerens TaxID=106592 RepID=UPI003CF722D9